MILAERVLYSAKRRGRGAVSLHLLFPISSLKAEAAAGRQGASSLAKALTAAQTGLPWAPKGATGENIPVYYKKKKTKTNKKNPIGKQVQGYCKVHRQRYQVLQAAAPPPSLSSPQAPPIPSTNVSSSVSRAHITVISAPRPQRPLASSPSRRTSLAPAARDGSASSGSWSEGPWRADALPGCRAGW